MKISSKIALAYIIKESSLGKSDKIELLNYVEHMDPKVAEKIINVNEVENYLKVSILMSTARSLGRLSYNRYMREGARACRERQDPEEKRECMASYKERALKARLNAIRKESAKCGQTMDASKCRRQFTDTLRRVENQIRALR